MPTATMHQRRSRRVIWRANLNVAAREFFQVSLITYLLLTLAETIKTGFVSNFFNMNYLLVVVLASGVAMVLTESADTAELTDAANTPASTVWPLALVELGAERWRRVAAHPTIRPMMDAIRGRR